MRKLNHYGFNLYKNGKFWFVVDSDNEKDAIKQMLDYIAVNKELKNFDVNDFTFREFKNHSTDGFELKQLSNF